MGSDSVVVASTTDSQDQVNAAAGAGAEPEVVEDDSTTPVAEEQQKTSGQQPEKKEEPKAEAKPPRAVEKRIDKLTYQLNKEKEEKEALAARIAELEKATGKVEVKEPEPQIIEVPETFPSKVDWMTANPEKSEEDYIDARSDWKFDLRQAQQAEADARSKAEAQQREIFDNYNQRLSEFKSEHDDFDEVVGNKSIQIPQSVQLAVLEMDNGPEIAYFIGQHPEEAKKMMNMSPAAAAAYVGKIAARLEPVKEEETEGRESRKAGPDKAPTFSSSKAPAPIRPLTGHSTKSTVPIDELPYDEYRKVRDRQEKERYRR